MITLHTTVKNVQDLEQKYNIEPISSFVSNPSYNTTHIHTSSSCKTSVSNRLMSTPSTSNRCFWDRHPFDGEKAVGIPVKYTAFPDKLRYNSITKDEKIITETYTWSEKGSYTLDGVFCSTECALAFAMDRPKDLRYKHSVRYILSECKGIRPALHWRTLSDYGGTLSIESFRNIQSFCVDSFVLRDDNSKQKFVGECVYTLYEL
jgi:hypothetical protein